MLLEFHVYVAPDDGARDRLRGMCCNGQRVHSFTNLSYSPRDEVMLTEERHCSTLEQVKLHLHRVQRVLIGEGFKLMRAKVECDPLTGHWSGERVSPMYYETHVPALVGSMRIGEKLTWAIDGRMNTVGTMRTSPRFYSFDEHVARLREAVAESAHAGAVFCGKPHHEAVLIDTNPDENAGTVI